MEQTVEEAANKMCEAWGMEDNHGYSVKDTFKVGFVQGAKWQKTQSPWISVEERLPDPVRRTPLLLLHKRSATEKQEKDLQGS